PLLVVGSEGFDPAGAAELRAAGAEVLTLPTEEGRLSVRAFLDELGRRRMTNVLVEGGAAVLGSFLDARAIDEVHVFLAPRLVGGAAARAAVAGQGVERIAEALRLLEWTVGQLDGDVYIHALLTEPAPS